LPELCIEGITMSIQKNVVALCVVASALGLIVPAQAGPGGKPKPIIMNSLAANDVVGGGSFSDIVQINLASGASLSSQGGKPKPIIMNSLAANSVAGGGSFLGIAELGFDAKTVVSR
jgi:hypothetical protein